MNADAQYTSNYSWQRGTLLEDSTTLGNTIASNRTYTINSTWNMEQLYNHIPFLKKTNERFKKVQQYEPKRKTKTPTVKDKAKDTKDGKGKDNGAANALADKNNAQVKRTMTRKRRNCR